MYRVSRNSYFAEEKSTIVTVALKIASHKLSWALVQYQHEKIS